MGDETYSEQHCLIDFVAESTVGMFYFVRDLVLKGWI